MAGKTHLCRCHHLLSRLGYEFAIPVLSVKGVNPLEVTDSTLLSRIRFVRMQHPCGGKREMENAVKQHRINQKDASPEKKIGTALIH
jgi:hypothetical protein